MSHHKFFHTPHQLTKLIFWTGCICIFLTSCEPKKLDYQFPATGKKCPIEIEWMGLQPGKSSQEDVLRIFGEPESKGKTTFYSGESIPYFAYKASGDVSSFARHRIFFSPNKKVYWIEAIVGDRDGRFHTVDETVDLLGNKLDTIYDNNTLDPFAEYQIDILSGPDTVLVWSECGMVLLALPSVVIGENGKLLHKPISKESGNILSLTYPNVMPSRIPVSDLNAVVLMEFIFEPTTFENFMEVFSYKIPYGLGSDYLRNIQGKVREIHLIQPGKDLRRSVLAGEALEERV